MELMSISGITGRLTDKYQTVLYISCQHIKLELLNPEMNLYSFQVALAKHVQLAR